MDHMPPAPAYPPWVVGWGGGDNFEDLLANLPVQTVNPLPRCIPSQSQQLNKPHAHPDLPI